ncbi:protein RIC-3 [Oryzias melastigma]|uniref:protein RIC-3 n=1 Tax=Oryzias melastigma TaxID=30732 RepID=UPI00168D90ED|nr:protein RIC-3 [Oryzias melastigma]
MTITTCQKVTLISCSVLCVSLFLPRMLLPKEKKEKGMLGVGPGYYRPMMHQLPSSGDPEQWDVNPSPSLTHTVEAMAKVKSGGRGKKHNLMAQVIPVYGFGILLYILYIMYKLTCNKKTNRSGEFTTNANVSNKKITDYELAQLQERLVQTERKLDRIVSGKSHFSSSSRRRRSKTSISKKEEKLLRQLRQITLLMQEGRLDGASPEMEAEEMAYGADWEGYPEETYPKNENPCRRHRVNMATLNEPPCQQTPEALAERMEQVEEEMTEIENVEEGIDENVEEEEEEEKKHLLPSPQRTDETRQERLGLEVSKELQSYREGKKQITFSDQKRVFHYPKQDTEEEEEEKEEDVEEEDEETEMEDEEEAEDDDPLMEAENLLFSCEEYSNPDEEAEEDIEEYLLSPEEEEEEAEIHTEIPKEVGVSGLRMRNRRDT